MDDQRIQSASMPQLAAAFRIVADKLLALHQAQKEAEEEKLPSWEEVRETQTTISKHLAAVVKHHVHDPDTLEAIGRDINALAQLSEEEVEERLHRAPSTAPPLLPAPVAAPIAAPVTVLGLAPRDDTFSENASASLPAGRLPLPSLPLGYRQFLAARQHHFPKKPPPRRKL